MTTHTTQSAAPNVAPARVPHNGEQLNTDRGTPEVLFKANGVWVPIDTPTAAIPAAPSPQQRHDALLLQAKRLLGEIAAWIESAHNGRV